MVKNKFKVFDCQKLSDFYILFYFKMFHVITKVK